MANTSKAVLISGPAKRLEGVTDEAITPGMLVERGGSNDVQKHSVAGGNAAPLFALPNDLVGDDLDDAYASGDTVQLAMCGPGAKVYALLAHGENVSAGAYLESDGLGALQAHTSGTEPASVVVRALEAKNNTTGSNARIEVEVL